MNDILITGGSGFVGAHLDKFLNSNGYPTQLVNRQQLNQAFIEIPANIKNVIHLAGKAHDLKKVSNASEYYDINYGLTKKIYDAFLISDAKIFIFMSSVKAAADKVDDILIEEFDPSPGTDYGKSKLMAENYIKSQLLPADKAYYILRPCMIHGPGNKGNLNMLYQFVSKGIPYPLGGFKNKRSYLSIENLCFLIGEIISSIHLSSGIYNLADDEALSTNEVVSILSEILNKKPAIWNIKPAFIIFFAKICDILHLPLTSERLDKLTESYEVSNKKIKQALNMSFPVSSREGLITTALSFKTSNK